MLNSQDRRPAFDKWYASLDDTTRGMFMQCATEQWCGLQEADGTADEPVSVIDCMENVWDHWRELALTLRDRPELLWAEDDRALAFACAESFGIALPCLASPNGQHRADGSGLYCMYCNAATEQGRAALAPR
jgi:hypothetical protein